MKYHIIIFVGHRRLAVLVSNEFQTAAWYQPRIMLFLINMKSTKTNLIIASLEGNNKYKTLKSRQDILHDIPRSIQCFHMISNSHEIRFSRSLPQ